MDLHFTAAEATPQERRAVDESIASEQSLVDATERCARRHLLLPVLHAIQNDAGWISPGAINYACSRLDVPPAEAYGVATFYHLFATQPQAKRVVYVCDDVACLARGVQAEECGTRTPSKRSPCLGLCDRAPAQLVLESGERSATTKDVPVPHVGGSPLVLLRRIGRTDPTSIQAYRAAGGYQALQKAIALGPERTIAEVTASKLLGRGGAAFPTGRKMAAVAAAVQAPHYLVCNADESEPGTFKDRILMEHDPFAVVEAMTIAALATGCERGVVYVRGEYPDAARRLQGAIDLARASGLLGPDVMGSGKRFDVTIRRGAGAYICGEETALFNSIEGKRGEPRSKPPFPVDAGLFGKPTQINNVETLANLLPILVDGGEAYARTGTPQSTGTRLFCLSGCVERPGLYEVPHGTTLGALVDMAGGVAGGRPLQAMLLGGAAGSLVGPEALAMRLSFEDARAAGATLGSGVVMLFDDSVDLRAILRRVARFFRDESCGQCVPCRVGTVRQEEALERLCDEGSHRAADIALISEIGAAMRDASICGLGQTAANVVLSPLALAVLSGTKHP